MCVGEELTQRSGSPGIVSQEIDRISLHNPIPLQLRLYGIPFLSKPSISHFSHRPLTLQLSTLCSPMPTTTNTILGSNPKNGPSSTASWFSAVTP